MVAHESYKPWRIGRPLQEEADLDIPAKIMCREEGRVGGAQKKIHASGRAREIVQGKRGRGGCAMPDEEKAPHARRNGLSP